MRKNLKLTPRRSSSASSIQTRPLAGGERGRETFDRHSGFSRIVTGPARVILRADEHEQFFPRNSHRPFTDPAWSPYFITAAGLVVEQADSLARQHRRARIRSSA